MKKILLLLLFPLISFSQTYISHGTGTAITSGGVPLSVSAAPPAPFNPKDIPGLIFWIYADTNVNVWNGSYFSQLTDLSGNNNHATQADETKQPLSVNVALNGKKVARFDGANDFVEFPEISTIRTVFFVVKNTNTVTEKYEPLLGHDVNYQWLGGAGITGTSLFLSEYVPLVANGYGYSNGDFYNPVGGNFLYPVDYSIYVFVLTGNGTSKYITNDRNQSGRYWTGDYAEIIIYDNELSSTNMDLVNNYLTQKYSIFWNEVPTMTSATTPSGIVTVSGEYSSDCAGWKLFDKNETSIWLVAFPSPQWVCYQFPTSKILCRYKIKASNSEYTRMPSEWLIEGSNNGSDWTTLDSRTGETGWSVYETREYSFVNVTTYTHYRMYITDDCGGDGYLKFNELKYSK